MIVIDASVWVSFLVEEDVNHAITHAWLTRMLATAVPLAAPNLLLAEVGGAIARRRDSSLLGQKTIDQLLAIPTLRLVNADHRLGLEASHIAATYRLRGADAFYVAVAAHLERPLVSWDKEHLSRVSDLITVYTPALQGS
jgi:predicted nucleic acid-binding protein